MTKVWQTAEPSGLYQHMRGLARFRDQRSRATLLLPEQLSNLYSS
jgi:hypothetical protein